VSVKDDVSKICRNQDDCGCSVGGLHHPGQGSSCKFVKCCKPKAGETGRQSDGVSEKDTVFARNKQMVLESTQTARE
jgi:hypothetical protein